MVCNIKRDLKKNVIKSIVFSAIIIITTLLFDCTYNYVVNGQFLRHVNDNRFVATVIFYTAEEDDTKYIENDELSVLFIDIYNECEEKQLLKTNVDAQSGWYERANHFTFSYDPI